MNDFYFKDGQYELEAQCDEDGLFLCCETELPYQQCVATIRMDKGEAKELAEWILKELEE